MRATLIASLALAAGCVPAASKATGPQTTANSGTHTAVEPAMLELDTARGSDGKWRLVIAGGARHDGDPPEARVAVTKAGEADRWRKLYTWKRFHDGITTLGGATVNRESGELQPRETDALPVITGPGSYTLKIDFGGEITERPVTIVDMRQTSGELGLAVDGSRYREHAALRFDRDMHGIDVGYPHEPRLWLTLPTPMTRETSRVDLLWYRGAEYVGESSHEQRLGGIGLATPHETLTRFWSWPKDVTASEMADGEWIVYAYQDGAYATACTFTMQGGAVAGRAQSSAALPCSKREEPPQVKRRAVHLPATAEDPQRKAELVALYKSEETRNVLRELIAARRAKGDAQMFRGMAVDAEEKAWTRVQADRAAARYERANADVKSTTKEINKLEKRYRELVAKHGR